MSDGKVLLAALAILVAADVVAVYVGSSNGMKYPFLAAVAVNVLAIIATHVVGIGWLIFRDWR